MKIASYEHNARPSWGIVTENGIIDLSHSSHATLTAALQADALDQLGTDYANKPTTLQLADVRFLPVIPAPAKIFCAGLNYEDHRLEGNHAPVGEPTLFLRVAESQVGHGGNIILPKQSPKLDYEAEIAVIIGKTGRDITEDNAWNHIAGYSAYNDASVRDYQRHTTQWTPGKNFDATGAFGPWMVTRGEIADGEVLTLESRLNGEVMQHATTDMLIFGIPRLIAYISSFSTLRPGDVIVTGTPGGVGSRRTPPVWMKAGDRIEIEVSKVGILSNTIVAAK